MKKANPDLVEAIKRCLGQTDEALTADRIFDLVSECDSLPAMAYTLNWMRNNGIIEGEPTGKRGAKNVPVMAYRLLTVQTPPQNTSPAEASTPAAADGSARGEYVVNGKTVNAVPSRASAVSDTGNMVELVMVKESPEKAPEKSQAAQPSAASAAAVKKTREGLAADAAPASSAADLTGDLTAATAAADEETKEMGRPGSPEMMRRYANGDYLRALDLDAENEVLRLANQNLLDQIKDACAVIDRQQAENEQLRNELGLVDVKAASLTLQVQDAAEREERLRQDNMVKANAIGASLERDREHEDLVTELRTQLEAARAELASSDQALAESMAERTRLTDDLTHQRNLAESWQQSSQELQAANQRLGEELAQAKLANQLLHGELEGARASAEDKASEEKPPTRAELVAGALKLGYPVDESRNIGDSVLAIIVRDQILRPPVGGQQSLSLNLDADDLAKIGEQINASLAKFHEQLKDGMEVVGKAWAAAIEQMGEQMADALKQPQYELVQDIRINPVGIDLDVESLRHDAARYAGETCQRRQELLDAEFKDVVRSVETLGLDYRLGRVVEFLAEGRASDGVNQVWALKRAQALLQRYVSQLEGRA